mgnify:CR=1 FL=1
MDQNARHIASLRVENRLQINVSSLIKAFREAQRRRGHRDDRENAQVDQFTGHLAEPRLAQDVDGELVPGAAPFVGRVVDAARGARLQSEIEPHIWVEGDPEALSIVLSNLLENALKYGGNEAPITIGVRLEDDFDGDANYTLAMAYTRTEMNALGAEWRSQVAAGQEPLVFTEWYQPLDTGGRWFVNPSAAWSRQDFSEFSGSQEVARFNLEEWRLGFAAGREFGQGPIVADDVGRHLRLGGEFAAKGLQGIEQALVGRRHVEAEIAVLVGHAAPVASLAVSLRGWPPIGR